MAQMPDVTAVWRNDGDHFTLVSPVRYDLMTTKAERQWFDKHAQELVDTQAAPYGPDLIATLPDNTTYSVAGDHGGIQRAAQEIPIVFAGAGLSEQGRQGTGAVGRHHADDPQGDGHHADRRRWTGSPTRCRWRRRASGSASQGGPVGLGWCVMQPSESDRAALQFIAEGVTELAGFGVAAIGVVRDGVLHTVAVAGDDEASEELRDIQTPVEALLAELENAEDWGAFKFVPHEREGSHLTAYQWIPDLDVADAPDAWHPHDLLCALLTDADGELRGVLSIDVPHDGRRPGPEQRRILELYARQAERAVITALERGEIARDLAQERAVAAYRSQLVDVLSHEVQNPLTAILHNAELLLEEGPHDDLTVRGLEAIQRGAERIQVMGADLLVLARVGNPVRPLAETVDLVAVARDACELLAAEAQQRSVVVRLVAEAESLPVLGDPQDLDAVVGNLVSNAIKYSEPGGRVRVLVRRCTGPQEAQAELVVEDDGVGIAEDERDRVFEEFFRSADPRVRERAGTGLGLAIVERAVSRHGGRVDVESAPDVGTRFRVLLPLVG